MSQPPHRLSAPCSTLLSPPGGPHLPSCDVCGGVDARGQHRLNLLQWPAARRRRITKGSCRRERPSFTDRYRVENQDDISWLAIARGIHCEQHPMEHRGETCLMSRLRMLSDRPAAEVRTGTTGERS